MYLLVAVISSFGYISIVFAKPEHKTYDVNVSDYITLRNMVFELQSLVLDQSEKIKALERQNVMQPENLKELRTTIETQNSKILQLQYTDKYDLANKSNLMEPKPRNFQSKKAPTFEGPEFSEKVMRTQTQHRIARASNTLIAFYAYSSQKFSRPSDHFVLSFDTVITNGGNSYHPHSGVFIAPRSGYYVFTWSLRVEDDAHISTELMVNGAPQSSIYFDATHYVGGNTSGTVVVQVNQGDEVFVRTTKDNFNGGDILSDYMGRTYFGGWLLHVA